jgi:peptidoglycan/LPS O-acetylase OafA/YrhL
MRSSSGDHWVALDHIRLLAVFMVFTWHFIHGVDGYPVPFEAVPYFIPFSLLDEGHTGVALFMTLSGYLFAKLLDNKQISYLAFFYNRALRLAPLLVLVMIVNALLIYSNGGSLLPYLKSLVRGFVLPEWPNGGWSIAVELHFYLLLPGLLFLLRRSTKLLVVVLLLFMILRLALFLRNSEIQTLAYWTILGRLDQFAVGLLAFKFRAAINAQRVLLIAICTTFLIFYWGFNRAGGFYQMPSYPSTNGIWIVLPLIEGVAYACFIAWYDSLNIGASVVSRILGRMGSYAYSIYLIHVFFVFKASAFIHEKLFPIKEFNSALLASTGCFLMMLPIAYLSYKFVESPFLNMRKVYSRSL